VILILGYYVEVTGRSGCIIEGNSMEAVLSNLKTPDHRGVASRGVDAQKLSQYLNQPCMKCRIVGHDWDFFDFCLGHQHPIE
jgi:hypothetical protein